MTNFMSSSVDLFKLRTIALNCAIKAPLIAALSGRVLFVISIVTLAMNLVSIALGSPNSGLVIAFNIGTSIFSFIVAWALVGASKEVYCRRNGLPVHPW